MKFIGFFVLMHCIMTLAAGLVLRLPPWIVCKALALGFQFGVFALWILAIIRFLSFFRRN